MKAPSEKHLEDWIVNNLQYLGDTWEGDRLDPHPSVGYGTWLNDSEYVFPYFNRVLKRQARFPSGIADLIASDEGSICAVELKAGAIDGEAISQALRYVYALRQIYDEITQNAYKQSQDVRDYFNYRNSVDPDRSDLAVKALVIGHSLKDKKLLRTAALTGVELAVYNYEPTTNHYTFEMLYEPVSDYEWQTHLEFAAGIIGDGIREIIEYRTAYAKEKGWRNG